VLPESPDALADVRALLAQGDAAAALNRLSGLGTALDAEALALRATAQQQLGQHAAAAQDYSAALAASPEVAAWWVGLGIALEAEGRPSEAINAFQQAERRGPLDPALSRYVGGRIEALSNGESTTR
jgi:MSHA biogenesis protein MshN